MSVSKTIMVLAMTGGIFVSADWAFAQFGVPISDPAPLNTDAPTESRNDIEPHITTDGSGNWLAVWAGNELPVNEYDIFVAHSMDNGATWTAPAPLNTNAAEDEGFDFAPRIATDGSGNWVAVWHSDDPLGDPRAADIDILVAHSTNQGATWSNPLSLNSNASIDIGPDGFPSIATDGSSNWLVVWTSFDDLAGTIGIDGDILAASSTNNGATWSDLVLLNTNAATDGDFDDDQKPHVATDGLGNWVAVWQSNTTLGGTIGHDDDILVARSTDKGESWTAPAPLNTNAATDNGNDGNSHIATDGAGNWVVVWQSNNTFDGTIGFDRDILVARSTDNGATWTDPAPLNTNAATDGNFGVDDEVPQIATDGWGNWVATWTTSNDLGGTIGTDPDILVARSTDTGATWTDPVPLNNNAATDSGGDFDSRLATDGAGNWVVVWTSSDDLGGTIGGDPDILVARFVLEPEAIPTVSEWGLLAITLLLLGAGTYVISKRRRSAA